MERSGVAAVWVERCGEECGKDSSGYDRDGATLGRLLVLKELFLGSFLALGCFKYLKNDFLGASILLLIAIVMSWFDVEVPTVHIASRTFFAGFFIVMGRAYKRMNVDADKWPITIMAFIIVSMGSVWCGTSMLSYSAIQILPYSVCAIWEQL